MQRTRQVDGRSAVAVGPLEQVEVPGSVEEQHPAEVVRGIPGGRHRPLPPVVLLPVGEPPGFLAHRLGEAGDAVGQRAPVAFGQRNPVLVELAALHDQEGVALGQAGEVAGLQHRHVGRGHPVLHGGTEMAARSGVVLVLGRGHGGHLVHLDVGQHVGEQFGGLLRPDAEHVNRVEVALDLLGLGAAADPRLDVGPGLGIGGDLEAGAAGLVQHGDELVADQLVEFVGMDADGRNPDAVRARHVGMGSLGVELAGHGGEVREHGVAHGGRHGDVLECRQAHVDDASLADDAHPVEDVAGIEVAVVRVEEGRHRARRELLEERQQGRDDLVEIGTVVLAGRQEALGDGVVLPVLLDLVGQDPGHADRPDVAGPFRGAERGDVGAVRVVLRTRQSAPVVVQHRGPVAGSVPLQPPGAVTDEELVDVLHVALDGTVGGRLVEPVEGLGDDVHEPPAEFLEGGAVALARQRIRDPGGDLGDPGIASHGVVAGGMLRMGEMEYAESVEPAAVPTGRVHSEKQVRIALGVEDDHRVPPADVLVDQDLAEPGLAHAGGAEHEGVAHPFADGGIQVALALPEAHAVDFRTAPHGRGRAQRIERVIRQEDPCEEVRAAAVAGPGDGPGYDL